jgi:thiopeptide-type bacteriocin biosynthesis protein
MPGDHLTRDWHHASIRFHDWDQAENVMTARVAPALDHLTADMPDRGWWFLRKYPHWRVRTRGPSVRKVRDLLGTLTNKGVIASWQPGDYEPEEHAFGGSTGMDIAHDLFCADTQGFLRYTRTENPPLGRRESSVLLISAMLTAAKLDWFERGDVLARVATMRPPLPAGSEAKLAGLAAQLQPLLNLPADKLVAPGGPAALADEWLPAFQDAGDRYAKGAADRTLTRGIRAILPHAIIFHWNRLGLHATTQGILATAIRDAHLPPD